MNRTLLDQCFRVTGRTIWYLEADEIHHGAYRSTLAYNPARSHQGYRLKGHTTAEALSEALGIEEPPAIVSAEGGLLASIAVLPGAARTMTSPFSHHYMVLFA